MFDRLAGAFVISTGENRFGNCSYSKNPVFLPRPRSICYTFNVEFYIEGVFFDSNCKSLRWIINLLVCHVQHWSWGGGGVFVLG